MLKDMLLTQPGHLIRRAHQISWAVFIDEAGLTPVQYSTLLVISLNPGIDATRLSELVSFDRATIGSVVERLEDKNLLRRKPGETDRRTKKMFLTPRGQRIVEKVDPMAPRIADRILERLNEKERSQLLRLLGKLVDIDSVSEPHGSVMGQGSAAKSSTGAGGEGGRVARRRRD